MFTSLSMIDSMDKIILRSLSMDTGVSLGTVTISAGFSVSTLLLYADSTTSILLFDGAQKVRAIRINASTMELVDVSDVDFPAGS